MTNLNSEGIAPPIAERPDPGPFVKPAEAVALTDPTGETPTEDLVLDVQTDRPGIFGPEMVVHLAFRRIGRRRMSLTQTPKRLDMARRWREALRSAPAVGPYRITATTFTDKATGEVRSAWGFAGCDPISEATLADYTTEPLNGNA